MQSPPASLANGDLDDSSRGAEDAPVEPNEESQSFADYDETSQSSSQPTTDDVKVEVKQETLDLESDTEETEFDDDEFDDNDPYSFSEDEAGLSPRQRKCSKPKIEKMKFEDSDDDLPYSGGSHCDEDRLMSNDISLKKISGIFKHEANGFNPVKRRKQQNRFNGISEEELAKRLLPDSIIPDLDILIIGINPGMYAAYKGHHYAGPGNHFWKCMFLSGLLPRPMCSDDDKKLLEFGIGFTNIVERTTRGSSSLSRQEIVGGSQTLIEKIKTYRPKIAVFNGKGIYEVFSGKKTFPFGKQPDKIDGTETYVWVMPNSSARCAQLPRAVDKVPYFTALKKFRDFLTGKTKAEDFNEADVVFNDVKLKNFYDSPEKKGKKSPKMEPGDENSLLDDGFESKYDPLTGKKRRGRPPKPRPDGTLPPPKRRRLDDNGLPLPRGTNPIDPLTGKKKRGRPKKTEVDGATPVKEKRISKKKLLQQQSNGFQKSDSIDSDFFGNPEGVLPQDLDCKPPMQPLPPFSPNFRRVDIASTLGMEGDLTSKLQHHVVSPKRENMEDCNPSPQRHDLPPQQNIGMDYGRQMMAMDMVDRVGSDSMVTEDERVRKYNRMCEYPTGPQQSDVTDQDMHLPPQHQHAHHLGQQQPPNAQQQYQSPSRYMNYSPSPTATKPPNALSTSTPTHSSYSPGNGAYGGFANGTGNGVHHPIPSPYDRNTHSATSKSSSSAEDVSTKSITGLESLVDQIPAGMSENDSGVFTGSSASSHPNTPRSVGPYSPAAGQFHPSPFHASTGGSFVPSQNHYVPSTSDNFSSELSSTNFSSGPASGPTDFSVNSLVHNTSATTNNTNSISVAASEASAVAAAASLAATTSPHFSVSDSFSVSSLTSSYDMASKYSSLPSGPAGNPYMQHAGVFGSSTPSFGPGFLGQGIGSGSFMNPSSMAGAMGMGAMGYYGPYSNTYGTAAAQSQGFAASPYAHGLHVPNPGYPYYGQSPYSQSPYF